MVDKVHLNLTYVLWGLIEVLLFLAPARSLSKMYFN